LTNLEWICHVTFNWTSLDFKTKIRQKNMYLIKRYGLTKNKSKFFFFKKTEYKNDFICKVQLQKWIENATLLPFSHKFLQKKYIFGDIHYMIFLLSWLIIYCVNDRLVMIRCAPFPSVNAIWHQFTNFWTLYFTPNRLLYRICQVMEQCI
jgi:hypothetical protein